MVQVADDGDSRALPTAEGTVKPASEQGAVFPSNFPGHPELLALCAMVRLHQVAAHPATLTHQFSLTFVDPIEVQFILRAAKLLRLKAKHVLASLKETTRMKSRTRLGVPVVFFGGARRTYRSSRRSPICLSIGMRCLPLFFGLSLPGPSTAKDYDCLLEASQSVEISSPVAGVLESVLVKRGDAVKKGQVIATLDSRAERAAMEAARLRSEAMGPSLTARQKIEFSGQKYERRKQMASGDFMPGQERDDAEAELRIAQAELQTAQENRSIAAREYAQQASLVAQRTLRSPFDGVVLDRLLSPGELTESSGTKKAILKLAQINPIRVHLVLPEQLFGRLKMSEVVRVHPLYAGVEVLSAKVSQIDRLIDAASGTFAVFLTIPNADLGIPAGMRCKVDL